MAEIVEIRMTGLDGVLDTLKGLPPEVVSKRGGPVRAALRKAAVVIQKEAVKNVRVVTANATDDVKQQNTKLLENNIVVTRGKAPFDGNGERYLVRVKRKTYPRTSGKPVTTLKTAQLLEYGSEKQPAEPWLRPAFNMKAREAIATFERELVRSIDRIIRKLTKGKGGLE
jgi:HK97 gp10 family phage protein